MYKSEGTETSLGFIEHDKFGEYRLPVMIETEPTVSGKCLNGVKAVTDSKGLPVPLIENGCLVFALPAGGKVVSSITTFSLHVSNLKKSFRK